MSRAFPRGLRPVVLLALLAGSTGCAMIGGGFGPDDDEGDDGVGPVGQPGDDAVDVPDAGDDAGDDAVDTPGLRLTLEALPRRVFDQTVSSGTPVTLSVLPPGVGAVDAPAVLLNLTLDVPTGDTEVRIWPTGEAAPVAVNLAVSEGETRANAVLSRVGSDGRVQLDLSSGSSRVIVDVIGGFELDGELGFERVAFERLLDTRGDDPIAPLTSFELDVGGEPVVVLNVTPLGTDLGYVAVTPAGPGFSGQFSTQNVMPGSRATNLVVVRPSGGRVEIFNQSGGETDFLVDKVAAFSPGSPTRLYPLAPAARAIDTRAGGSAIPALGDDATVAVGFAAAGVPAQATAVALNAVVYPEAATAASIVPAGTQPETSNLNAQAGRPASVAGLVPLGQGGEIAIHNQTGEADLVLDLVGFFADP